MGQQVIAHSSLGPSNVLSILSWDRCCIFASLSYFNTERMKGAFSSRQVLLNRLLIWRNDDFVIRPGVRVVLLSPGLIRYDMQTINHYN